MSLRPFLAKRWPILALSLIGAIAIVFVPALLPTGPQAGLDATKYLDGGQLWFAGGVIFLGGLLTSLTPCVYPLIPITVGVFGARHAQSRAHAILLTSAYVIGMGLVFAVLGVVAALAGKAFGTALGNPLLVIGLALFLLALAASMFGAFDLALPSGLATKLNGVGGTGPVGALLMGAVSGFLAAPCTGPVLSGVLTFVSRTQDPYLGGTLLFIYALGIGVPFFLIGAFLVRLPKGGLWMEWVKSIFGIALVALAISYVKDASPGLRSAIQSAAAFVGTNGVLILSAVLVIVGVVLGAIHFSFKDGSPLQRASKSFGVLAVVVALTLRTVSGAAPASEHSLRWTLFNAEATQSAAPFDELLRQAKATCRPVMVDFFAEWCAACKELDNHTYTANDVVAEAERFVNIKVDGTNDHEVLESLYERFGVTGLPTVAFIDGHGDVLNNPKVTGFLPPDRFLAELKKVAPQDCAPKP